MGHYKVNEEEVNRRNKEADELFTIGLASAVIIFAYGVYFSSKNPEFIQKPISSAYVMQENTYSPDNRGISEHVFVDNNKKLHVDGR